MSIMMVCPRDYTLRTRMGHTVEFVGGEPTPVPEAAYAEALAKNILPVKVKDNEKPVFEHATAEITGTLRDALIFQTIDEIVKENTTEDFGGGVPKAAAISARIGIAVAQNEAAKYWTMYKQIKGENSELPTHPNTELVREVQALSTRKQLEDYARDADLPLSRTKGKSLKELKDLVLYTVVNQRNVPSMVLEGVEADPEAYVPPASLMED
jgi:hypothetical protein